MKAILDLGAPIKTGLEGADALGADMEIAGRTGAASPDPAKDDVTATPTAPTAAPRNPWKSKRCRILYVR